MQVKNHLFDAALNGMDLIALNIQRGRDHGLRGYNDYRHHCQVGRASNFSELRNTMSDKAIAKLRSVYNSIDDIDLYAGAMMETPGVQFIFVGPESGPEPGRSHVWSFVTCVELK